MSTALVWFRRDLRLSDNPALAAACERHARVVPVYIHAPDEDAPWTPGAASRWWLHHSLAALDRSLRGQLVIRRGPSLPALRTLARECGAQAIYWNRLYEPVSVARDTRIKTALRAENLDVESFNGALWLEPQQLKNGSGEPYRVFTPFWKALQQRLPPRALLPEPRTLKTPATLPGSLRLEALELLPRIRWDAQFFAHWTPGEDGAHARLNRFCEEILDGYSGTRDLPSRDGTSRLSPHLHFGEISPLQVHARVQRLLAQEAGATAGAENFLREVGWREFAHHLLFHFPHTTDAPLDERFAAMRWRKDHAEDLRRWQRGVTGIPIVDAGMRELWATGFMHNRVRMIVASLLTKNLLIPWQEGARWFWDTLVDADLANNTLGWQWVAGCGADAAPYFRVFNPRLQSEKFDAAAYIRRWVPELAQQPDAQIHAPPPVTGYPSPMVDLKATRERALDAWQRIRSS